MALDDVAARRAVDGLADRLGMSIEEAAEGVITIVNANMANAIRSRTVQKGIDPRDYALVAFGGAGPLHGAEVAAMLDIPEVIVPAYPGITSAVGLLTTDLRYDVIKTEFQVSTDVDRERLNADFEAMESELRRQFEADGIEVAQATFERFGDLRYVGQGYELRILVPDGALDEAAIELVFERFHERHRVEYGHFFADSPIEIVNARLTGVGPTPKINEPEAPVGGSLDEAGVKTANSVFRVKDGLREFETAIYRRDRLPADQPFEGPAVILQTDSTTVVPPGWSAAVDSRGNLLLTRGGPG